MKKRVFCIVLAVMLCLSALPLSVFAYAHDETAPLPEGVYKTWKQYDARWTDVIIGVDPWYDSAGVYHEYETVGHAGCLISSMAILARAYGLTLADGTEINPGTLATAMYDGGSCKYLTAAGGAKYDTAFETLIPGVRFAFYKSSYQPAADIAALLANDEKEYAVIVGVNGWAHYVAVDYVQDGEVYICDTGYPKTKLSEYNFTGMLVFEIDESHVDGGEIIPAKPTWVVEEPDGIRIRGGAGLSYERTGAYAYGAEIEVLETAEADGYLWGRTSLGWCALRSLDGTEVFCVCTSDAKYSVTYHTNGGEGAPEMQYKTAGESLTLRTEIPTKEGYTFLGWSPDPTAVSAKYAPGASYHIDDALVLYAVWMKDGTVVMNGIDVSSYQGEVDWQTVAASGVDFVILRAGTSGGKDEMFEQNYLGAKEAGLHVGAYFFTYALNEQEVETDAALFLEWLEGKTFDMPVFIDVETNDQKALPAGVLTALTAKFQAIVRDAGYYCGVYSSETWYNLYLDGTQFGGKEFLWVAKWTLSGTLSQNMSESFSMYQYSETGTVPGIVGAVDLDVCYVDFPTLITQTPVGPEPPPDEPEPPEDEPEPPADVSGDTSSDEPSDVTSDESSDVTSDEPSDDTSDESSGPPNATPIDPPSEPPSDLPSDPPPEEPEPKDPAPKEDSGLAVADTVLYGGSVGMTADAWQALFDGTVFFESAEGEAMLEDAVIRTGDFVICGQTVFSIAVRGDLDGDGTVSAVDYMKLKRYVLGTYDLQGAAYYAGCLSGSEISAGDYMKLKRYVIGTYDIYA
ncbi:MAG: InlB B-repeat-containing protein [Clostridia bacterium]|nr:InlB B-repeat-containing protein [Clostridia bacterium]